MQTRAVDRPEDPGGNPRVLSGHVLSETAGATLSCSGAKLNSLPRRGDEGGLHRRGKPISSARGSLGAGKWRFEPSVRRWASYQTPGTGAKRRGFRIDPKAAACAGGGEARQPEQAPWIERKRRRPSQTLHEIFAKTSVVVVAQYSGLTVAQMQRLRKQMKQAGAKVQVAKNRLAQIALKGTDVAAIGPLLKGPTLIAHSNDPVAAAKAAVAFAKDNDKFVLLGGAMGKTALNVEGVKVACDPALARRTARQAAGAPHRPGDQARPARQRAGRQGRARGVGLRQQGRSLTPGSTQPKSIRTT